MLLPIGAAGDTTARSVQTHGEDGMEGKSGYHHGDLRRALLGAAISLLAEHGAADLSLREVARRAGVSYSAPYHHFADKSALLAAVAREGFEGLVAALEANAHGHRTLRKELTAMAKAYVAFALASPAHYRVMFLPEVKHSMEAEALHVVADQAFDLLAGRVGHARKGEPAQAHQEIATTVWAALHGLSLLAIDGSLQHKFGDAQDFIDRACSTVIGMVFDSVT